MAMSLKSHGFAIYELHETRIFLRSIGSSGAVLLLLNLFGVGFQNHQCASNQ